MKRFYFIMWCVAFVQMVNAQVGGGSTYDFLNLTNSARVGALGGTNVSIPDNDINLAYHNPALLQKNMDNELVLNYVPYIADISYGYIGFAKHFEPVGTFSLGVHNVNYGDFIRTDENRQVLGSATGAEYAFILSYAKQLSPTFSMGMSFKPIYSKLDVYSSFGLAADFGIHYYKKEKNLSMGIVLKNIGSQISSYNEEKESLPTDLQIGITKKLAHAPFRFSVTAQHLLNWDLTYTSTDTENGGSSTYLSVTEGTSQSNNLMRHMVFGVEFLPAKNFHVDFGYNYRRRKELAYKERMSTAGISWGFGFRVYKFHFSYGSARYHLGGTSNHFSVTTNLTNY